MTASFFNIIYLASIIASTRFSIDSATVASLHNDNFSFSASDNFSTSDRESSASNSDSFSTNDRF